MRAPDLYFHNNFVNTLNLLDVMRERNVRKIVFSSSCTTYGYPQQIPIPENHPQNPVNPYGESKLMVERLLHWYGSIYELSRVALRYFKAAGADPEGELGEEHESETHLIPLALSATSGVMTDYNTPDGPPCGIIYPRFRSCHRSPGGITVTGRWRYQ